MKPSYVHKSLKGLEDLEPINSQPLHEKIYQDILIAGQDYTPENAAEHRVAIDLLRRVTSVCKEFWMYKGEFADPFGAYMEGSFQTSEKSGQFFTPSALCRVMTEITLGQQDMLGSPKIYSDPCSGTGRFMLNIAEHYARKNHGIFNFLMMNTDVEMKAFVYCTMNAWLHGIPALNIWGNSLTMEVHDAFMTFQQVGMPPQCVRIPAEAARDFMEAPFMSQTQEKRCAGNISELSEQSKIFDFIGGVA